MDQKQGVRREHDLLGDRDVPADAYYGVHTLRAMENFPITGIPIAIYPDLVDALAAIKQAAALANRELRLLDAAHADFIVKACERIRAAISGPIENHLCRAVCLFSAGINRQIRAA